MEHRGETNQNEKLAENRRNREKKTSTLSQPTAV